jgi:hypothetical protein
MPDMQSLKNNEPLSDFHRRHLVAQLGQARRALEEAKKLAGMPFGRFDGRAVPRGWDVAGTEMQMRSNVAQLLGCDVIEKADRGQIDEALVSVAAALNARRSGGDEPNILVAIAGQSGVWAANNLQFALAHGVASNESLAKLQSILEEQDRAPVLLNIVRAERAEAHNRMSRVESGELDASWAGMPVSAWSRPLSPLLVPRTHAWALRFFGKCLEIAKLPSPDRQLSWDALMATIDGAPLLIRSVLNPRSTRDRLDRTQENQTALRCMIVALAAERFRLKNGRWPASVSNLEKYMSAESTVDPVTGKALEIRKNEDGLLICGHYSQSKDLRLRLDSREGVRFRLWDVARRGQKNLASASGSAH